MIRLPVLLTTLDAGDLHTEYSGLLIVMRLNVAYPEYAPPWKDAPPEEQDKLKAEQPWASEYWVRRARAFVEVVVPAALSDDGNETHIPIPDGKTLRELETREDFDPAITMWASAIWAKRRDEHLGLALGN